MIRKTIFAVVLVLTFTLSAGAFDEVDIPTLKIGAKAPDFDLPGIDGKNWKLKDFDNSKVLVIIFTCV
ncbi:MAG TPA: redoxin, partial [Blastocatellia bacterium]|nr:redoxin [Blastocatellia bacterium]